MHRAQRTSYHLFISQNSLNVNVDGKHVPGYTIYNILQQFRSLSEYTAQMVRGDPKMDVFSRISMPASEGRFPERHLFEPSGELIAPGSSRLGFFVLNAIFVYLQVSFIHVIEFVLGSQVIRCKSPNSAFSPGF